MSVHTARLMLVAQRRDTIAPRDPNSAKVRRYRLARVQLNSAARGAARTGGRADFGHLKQLHD
jgi:hypothetical protein